MHVERKMFTYKSQDEFMKLFQDNFKIERGDLDQAPHSGSSQPSVSEENSDVAQPKQQWLNDPVSKPVQPDFFEIPDIAALVVTEHNVWASHIFIQENCIPKIVKSDKLLYKLKNAKQILLGCKKHKQCHGDLLLELA